MWIPLDRVVTFAGFSYREGGWHPYRETVRWLQSTEDPSFESSPLYHFYRQFQPSALSEIFDGLVADADPLVQVPAWKVAQVWTLDRGDFRGTRRPRQTLPDRRRRSSEHVGPITEDYGELKLAKLSRLIESISTFGYRPMEFDHGVVEGLFLVDGRHVAFLPTEGQHRLAVLAESGVTEILVRQRPSGPTVRVDQLPKWARHWGLGSSHRLPHELFRFYFESDGAMQADRWDLR